MYRKESRSKGSAETPPLLEVVAVGLGDDSSVAGVCGRMLQRAFASFDMVRHFANKKSIP